MYCAHCGKPIPDEALFCQCCGNRCDQTPKEITEEKPAQPQSQPEMPTGIPLPPSQTMGRYAEAREDTPFSSQGADRMTDGPGVPYKADESEPKLPPSGNGKKKLPKWMWITLCTVATVLIGLLILLLLNPEDLKPSSESEAPSASVAQQPADETAVAPREGECFYIGHSTYFDIDDLEFSFILSADKSYIYGVTIKVTNLSASVTSGNTTTGIKVSSSTESFSGQYPIDFRNGTGEILLGASKMKNLCFDGATAWFELDYTYLFSGTNGQQTEIPFGNTFVELTTEDDAESYPPPAESPETTPEEAPAATVFDEAKLKNWDANALSNTYGVSDIYVFTPSSPVPMQYIVCADKVIDPVTGQESEGGYNKSYSRHLPISTGEMLRTSGNLRDGGLTLTDDPNKATYALVLHYSYENNIGSFRFGEDNSVVPQYHATLNAELVNLVSGERIASATKDGYATYANESVYSSMLDAAKGKQFYGGTISLYADDFEEYWSFVKS